MTTPLEGLERFLSSPACVYCSRHKGIGNTNV
jgi:hypothetical protein